MSSATGNSGTLTSPGIEKEPTPMNRPDNKKLLQISMVVPAHNEAESIRTTLQQLHDILTEWADKHEIIVVDDGSTDNTLAVLQSLPFPVRVISHPYCKGNGSSVKTGILAARLTYVGIIDADGQHPPAFLPQMIQQLGSFDLVVAARNYTKIKRREVGNFMLAKLASYLTSQPIPDLTCGYRLFKRELMLEFVHLIPRKFSFPSTSTIAFITSGHTVKFVDMPNVKRSTGKSKIRFWSDGVKFALIATRIVMLFNPMRVFFPTFCLFMGAGLFWSIRTFFVSGQLSPIGTGMFLAGILTFLFGLLAEQVCAIRVQMGALIKARIKDEEKERNH